MEELKTPLPEDYSEIDDEEIVMPDKRETTPYPTQEFSSMRFESKR